MSPQTDRAGHQGDFRLSTCGLRAAKTSQTRGAPQPASLVRRRVVDRMIRLLRQRFF
jgi:hypothetical protein